jgi:hypothetical protein
MAFDVNKMFAECCYRIDEFCEKHMNETFYGFVIQFGGLHLNSVERFKWTLKYYQERFPHKYDDTENQNRLKWSVGDWAYTHFISLENVKGYDPVLFEKYYELCFDNNDPDIAKGTDYYKAMNELFNLIMNSDVLDKLKRTPDFKGYFIAADD